MTFDATVGGVQGFVQTFSIGPTSKPTTAEVVGFVAEMDGRVSALLGTLDTLPVDRKTVFTTAARALVHLGAAAMTSRASSPESVRGGGNYGATLWERWYADADRLAKAAQQARNDAAAGSTSTGVRRASVFGNAVEISDTQVW